VTAAAPGLSTKHVVAEQWQGVSQERSTTMGTMTTYRHTTLQPYLPRILAEGLDPRVRDRQTAAGVVAYAQSDPLGHHTHHAAASGRRGSGRGARRASTPEVFLPQAQTLLARCGVALILLPHLPKTYAHGATFWLTSTKAVVQMSIRGSWADIFWFSLFHELAHVLLHSKRHIFIEGEGGEDPAWRTQEDEANSFAGDVLIPPGPYRAFTGQGIFTAGAIRQFAAQRGIAPGVVVGRLQHDSFIERNQVNGLRERYRWADA